MPEGERYLAALAAAANYAFVNRQLLAHRVKETVERTLRMGPRDTGIRLVYDCGHNNAKFEHHEVEGRRRRLLVHRKGATRAFPPGHPDLPDAYRSVGQPVFIPGDMGTGSYVLAGAEGALRLSLGSTCHGAGRRMSRTQAMHSARGRSVASDMERRGVLVACASKRTLAEEIPEAYKNVSGPAAGLGRENPTRARWRRPSMPPIPARSRPSDPMRWIHWKSTARHNKFYVRQFEGTPAGDWWILLDLDSETLLGTGRESTEEHGVILAASLVARGLQQEHPVGLAVNGGQPSWDVPRRNEYQQRALLKSLAVASPFGLGLQDYLHRIGPSLGSHSSLLIITANADSAWTESLLPLMWRGTLPTVFLLDPASFGGRGDSRPLCDALQMMGIPCHIIPKDLIGRPDPARQGGGMGVAHFGHRQGSGGEDPGCRLAEAGMTQRLFTRLFSAEILGPVLVVVALQMLSYGISSSLRGTDTSYLAAICLISAALGWLPGSCSRRLEIRAATTPERPLPGRSPQHTTRTLPYPFLSSTSSPTWTCW